jgi:hypothetical protein
MNGLNLRCTTLCLPSSIRTLALRLEWRLPVSFAPWLTNIMVTTAVVKAKRAAVPVDIMFWRLMTPKNHFVVGHGSVS